jgi:cobalt-zinc-cadmium efflux system outer membrane protein
MSSKKRTQHLCRAALGVMVVLLLGALPSVAVDEGIGKGIGKGVGEGIGRRPGSNGSHVGESLREERGASLTLRDALALALGRSPVLASFSWEIRAREAGTLQVGMLPNPTFSAEVENVGGSGLRQGARAAETTLLLSQLIELGGKRRKRRSLGALGARVAEWDYEVARLGVVAETTRAFVDALALQDAVALADEQIRLADEVFRAVQAQVRAGAVSSAEVPRAQVEVTKQEIERGLRDRALRAAYVRLATAWGASEPTFSVLAGDLDVVSAVPSEADLVQRMASTPELARWQAEVATRRAAVDLADARRIPDVTLGLGPRHFNDTNDWALVVGVQVPLPVFDRNQGARRESRSQLSKSREDRRTIELQLRRSLAQLYQGLASAYEEATALRERAIPNAEQAYEATKNAQRQGALRFTEVLDAQRSLFALRTQLVDALASYHLSRAQTEALIGGPLSAEKDSIE